MSWWLSLKTWQQALAVLAAILGLGYAAGQAMTAHAEDHGDLSREQKALTGSIQELVDWQHSEEKRRAQEEAAKAEKRRIAQCVADGNDIEDCL